RNATRHACAWQYSQAPGDVPSLQEKSAHCRRQQGCQRFAVRLRRHTAQSQPDPPLRSELQDIWSWRLLPDRGQGQLPLFYDLREQDNLPAGRCLNRHPESWSRGPPGHQWHDLRRRYLCLRSPCVPIVRHSVSNALDPAWRHATYLFPAVQRVCLLQTEIRHERRGVWEQNLRWTCPHSRQPNESWLTF